jgi:Bacteriocin-protection, YdeI or OmpD-Associated
VGAECEKRATISRVERFKAILGGEVGGAPTVELPFDAKERFGRARAPVRGTDERTVELPPALAAAFDEDEDAREAFDRLSYSHRREYAEWIAEAKRDDTRSRRVAKTLGQLRKSPP